VHVDSEFSSSEVFTGVLHDISSQVLWHLKSS